MAPSVNPNLRYAPRLRRRRLLRVFGVRCAAFCVTALALASVDLQAQPEDEPRFDEDDSFFVPLEDTDAERAREAEEAGERAAEAERRRREAEGKARRAAESREREREARAERRAELERRRREAEAQRRAEGKDAAKDATEAVEEQEEPDREEAAPETADADQNPDQPFGGDTGWQAGGRLRQHIEYLRGKPPPATEDEARLFTGWTSVRGELSYRPEALPNLHLHGALDLDLVFSNYQGEAKFGELWRGTERNRLLQLEYESYADDEPLLRAEVHRLYTQYDSGAIRARLGRFAARWNETRFYDPLDLVTPAGPFALYADELPGSDGLHLVHALAGHATESPGGESAASGHPRLELVLTPYRSENNTNYGKLNSRNTNLLLRYDTGVRPDDRMQAREGLAFAVSGGRHFRSWVWGGDLRYTTEAGTYRLAYLGRDESPLDDYPFYEDVDPRDRLPDRTVHQLVLGFRRPVFWGLDWNLELLLNGAAITTQNDRGLERSLRYETQVRAEGASPANGQGASGEDGSFFRTAGRVITRNSTLVQTSFARDFGEDLRGELLLIGDPLGRSLFVSPRLQLDFEQSRGELGAWLFALPTGSDADEAEFYGPGETRIFARFTWMF